MKTSIKYLQPTTINFLIKNIGNLDNYKEVNNVLSQLSGIDTFFRNQYEFSNFLVLLKPNLIVCEETNRREYGDFQTPSILTDAICSYLVREGILPEIIIEPTFGKGSFIISALKFFPKLKKIYGLEIYESYYWETKFKILDLFITNSDLHKSKIFLYLEDVFNFNFGPIERSLVDYNVLVLGNPPWVTNAELGSLNSKNLPKKSNFKSFNGLEAITGKGNFDIGEYIILMMLNSFSEHNGNMAMLAKNSVIKNLIHDLPKTNYKINNMTSLSIDAKKYFGAAVNASLFKCNFKSNNPTFTCKVSSLSSQTIDKNEFGWVRDKFVSNIAFYKNNKKYDGISPYIWRQGVKHDCSKIMELNLVNNQYVNGLKIKLDLEKDLIYGLVKSSDLNSPIITKTRKHVIITQKSIGEDTAYISNKFPKLYRYLIENYSYFEKRKSSIYKNKPPFSIFGIGDYSFKPFKVAISGLYKRSSFALLLPENDKPLMLDDTCYSLGFDDLSEAIFVWCILNSEYIQQFLTSIVFLDEKRPYTKDILMRIAIDKVAIDINYEKIIQQIKILDEQMILYITEKKWNLFLRKIVKENQKVKQLTLF